MLTVTGHGADSDAARALGQSMVLSKKVKDFKKKLRVVEWRAEYELPERGHMITTPDGSETFVVFNVTDERVVVLYPCTAALISPR